MADVYNYVIPQGVIQTDTNEIQNEVITEFQNTFGSDLITAPNTPQGALIVSESLSRAAVADNNVAVANQINPNLAGGVYLDAILELTGSQRTPATSSVVTCSLSGVAGTIIPVSSIAQDTNGNQWASKNQVTLSSEGDATVDFAAVATGSITVGIGDLNTIISGVLGWTSVTNAAVQYITGSATQNDAQARSYRRNTLAIQGLALPQATISGLYATPGVTSVFFQENISPSTETIKGVTMIGHSIYACVAGGSDTAVATVLMNKKSAGCAYSNGAGTPVTVDITNPYSGQVLPILFDRPTPIAINVIVNINSGYTLSDPVAAVQQAIVDYANGVLSNGEQGLGVGVPVSSFELAGAINVEYPGIFVKSVLIAYSPTVPSVSTELAIGVFQQATIASSAITVNQS
jgi:hypothetical protein